MDSMIVTSARERAPDRGEDATASAVGLRERTDAVYLGRSTALGRIVFVDRGDGPRPLPLRDASPSQSYAWGRGGAGPREVARAILLDATGNEMLSERLCRPLTWDLVSHLPHDYFRLTSVEVLAWVEQQALAAAA
jgi:hypothetical protein